MIIKDRKEGGMLVGDKRKEIRRTVGFKSEATPSVWWRSGVS